MTEKKNKKKSNNKKGQDKKPFMIITDSNRFVTQNMLDDYALKGTETGSNQLLEDPFSDAYGEFGLVEPLYQPEYLLNLAEVNTYHDICCDTKAQDIGGLGWKLIPLTDNPSEADKETLTQFFNRVFLDNPITKAQSDKEQLGYCSIELVREGNQPQGMPYNLYHVPAHTIRIHKDHNRFCQKMGSNYAWFRLVGTNKDTPITATGGGAVTEETNPETSLATEIIWNINHTSRSSYYGRPRAIPAIRAIFGHVSLMDYNISFFKNYGVPAYAVFVSGNYSDELVDTEDPSKGTKLQESIRERFYDIQNNPHSTMVFSVPSDDSEGKVEIKFERLSVETKEASFQLYRSDNRDEIITAHRMDPYRVGININGPLGGNAADVSRRNYKSSVQTPEQKTWENLINTHIIVDGFGIVDWRFELISFDLEDEDQELSLVQGVFGLGAMTPNQVIEKYGERLGLETVDHPLMNSHYMGGVALEGSGDVNVGGEVVVDTLKALKERLEGVALKYDDKRDDTGDRGNNINLGIVKKA